MRVIGMQIISASLNAPSLNSKVGIIIFLTCVVICGFSKSFGSALFRCTHFPDSEASRAAESQSRIASSSMEIAELWHSGQAGATIKSFFFLGGKNPSGGR
jgi:hypothetical protein